MTEARRMTATRGPAVTFHFEGQPVTGYCGETLATALLAAQVSAFGLTREGTPRLPFCNMGTCFDCVVTVDGQRLVRACLTEARDGLCVTRHETT
jgi:predicted molibdopterin-dependent oxidoreductase YjgC